MSIKIQIARAQLGTALDLFIRDRDPYSVHSLACGGSEIVEGLAKEADLPSISTHILQTIPDIDQRKLKRLRNQHWNALKHFYEQDGKTVRDDEALMADFTDEANDAVLFGGWLDYLLVTKRLPVEAQVFQVWWYATNPKSMNPDVDPSPWQSLFPKIDTQSREEQKRRLRRAVEKWRNSKGILQDPRTELEPLSPKA
ncbi:hypothetical protein [Rhizobium leguminosarum]|uniref:hypothetical protein n=1 Tax=Rhizobium TaxID=379 RepID=UPI0013B7E102|nr:hypothetical protein [Rhizobium leguminosarum]MBY5320980.1 hypothetical protein [Rhizobium leguminosarum]MBY5380862.1 hypothetical protein [Rhizobium leguminosarum]MCA2432167.1 hypothetical protein [Rhizobium leguminosarum]NEH42662.1 hypothetical protein [Rhizobium leguminosarum]NEH72434.1 hypothetical protein [Rhizobium leguminosarum]